MTWIKRIFVLLTIIILSSCTVLGTYMDPQDPAPTYHVNGHDVKINFIKLNPTWLARHNTAHVYRIGPYDILNIIVWDHPELTTITTQQTGPNQSGFLVNENGYINYPFAGNIKVSGLTIPQAEQLITRKISNYIRNPQINIRVADFRSQEVQIMGEVSVRNIIRLNDRPITLLDALNKSGGTDLMTANTTSIFVIRGNLDNLTVFGVDLKSPQMMMLAQLFILKNNDIVYVPPIPITSWNRVISQLSPTLGAPNMVKSTISSIQGQTQ